MSKSITRNARYIPSTKSATTEAWEQTHADVTRRHEVGDITADQLANAYAVIANELAIGDAWEANRDHCPSWCSHHEIPGVHSHAITVGGAWVAVERVESPSGVDLHGVYVTVGDVDEMQGDMLRDFTAALVEAQRIIGNA